MPAPEGGTDAWALRGVVMADAYMRTAHREKEGVEHTLHAVDEAMLDPGHPGRSG